MGAARRAARPRRARGLTPPGSASRAAWYVPACRGGLRRPGGGRTRCCSRPRMRSRRRRAPRRCGRRCGRGSSGRATTKSDRAVELLDGGLEHLDRVDVEMVGGLVQHQAVGPRSHQQQELQPRPLAAREGVHLLAALLVAEQEPQQCRGGPPPRCTAAASAARPPGSGPAAPARAPGAGTRPRSTAPSRSLPPSARARPTRSFTRTLLPEPLSPITPTRSPRNTVRSTPIRTGSASKATDAPRHSATRLPPRALAAQPQCDLAPLEHRPLDLVHPLDAPLRCCARGWCGADRRPCSPTACSGGSRPRAGRSPSAAPPRPPAADAAPARARRGTTE